MVYKIALAWLSGLFLGLIAISLAFHITVDDLRGFILSVSHTMKDNQGRDVVVYRVVLNDIERVRPIKEYRDAKPLPNELVIKPSIIVCYIYSISIYKKCTNLIEGCTEF